MQRPAQNHAMMITAVITFRPSDAAADTESYSSDRKAVILRFTYAVKNRRVGTWNRMIFEVILI